MLGENEKMNSVPVKKIMAKWKSVMDWAIVEIVEEEETEENDSADLVEAA